MREIGTYACLTNNILLFAKMRCWDDMTNVWNPNRTNIVLKMCFEGAAGFVAQTKVELYKLRSTLSFTSSRKASDSLIDGK